MRFLPFVFLLGCPKLVPGPGFASSVPTIIAAFQSSAILADLGAGIAVSSGSYEGCLVGKSVAAAATSGAEAIAGSISGTTLPSISVDVSECLALGESPEGAELVEWIDELVSAALQTPAAILTSLKSPLCLEDPVAYGWSLAALEYAQGAAGPVIDEISSPDGVLEIPAVAVDLELCED